MGGCPNGICVKKRFTYRGEGYEVRVWETPEGHTIKAYKGDKPANGYSYHVDRVTEEMHDMDHFPTAEDHLITLAQSDVETDMWEKYVAAVTRARKGQE